MLTVAGISVANATTEVGKPLNVPRRIGGNLDAALQRGTAPRSSARARPTPHPPA